VIYAIRVYYLEKKGSTGRNTKKFISNGVVVAAVVVLAGFIGYQTSSSGTVEQTTSGSSNTYRTQDSSAASGNKLALSTLISGGSPPVLRPTASVTIVEFGDFKLWKIRKEH
jgi:hypothetical protein